MDRDLFVLVLRCCIRGQREGERRYLSSALNQCMLESQSDLPSSISLLTQQPLPSEGVVQAEGAAPLLLRGWAQIRSQWEWAAGGAGKQKKVRRSEDSDEDEPEATAGASAAVTARISQDLQRGGSRGEPSSLETAYEAQIEEQRQVRGAVLIQIYKISFRFRVLCPLKVIERLRTEEQQQRTRRVELAQLHAARRDEETAHKQQLCVLQNQVCDVALNNYNMIRHWHMLL